MSNIFAELQKTKKEQHQAALQATPLPQPPKTKEPKATPQKVTYSSKGLSKPLSKNISKSYPSRFTAQVTTEAIETMMFVLRKQPKFRVNADVPTEWKEELDEMAFVLKVGKYELLTYLIGIVLGKLERPET